MATRRKAWRIGEKRVILGGQHGDLAKSVETWRKAWKLGEKQELLDLLVGSGVCRFTEGGNTSLYKIRTQINIIIIVTTN